jgi:hypothetical protein
MVVTKQHCCLMNASFTYTRQQQHNMLLQDAKTCYANHHAPCVPTTMH